MVVRPSKRVLSLLVDDRENRPTFSIYENAKFSTTIDKAFNSQYRKVDIDYDTTSNNRFKKCNLLVDDSLFLDVKKKSLYLDLLNSNKEFIKNNKVSSEIIDNQKHFENLDNKFK